MNKLNVFRIPFQQHRLTTPCSSRMDRAILGKISRHWSVCWSVLQICWAFSEHRCLEVMTGRLIVAPVQLHATNSDFWLHLAFLHWRFSSCAHVSSFSISIALVIGMRTVEIIWQKKPSSWGLCRGLSGRGRSGLIWISALEQNRYGPTNQPVHRQTQPPKILW